MGFVRLPRFAACLAVAAASVCTMLHLTGCDRRLASYYPLAVGNEWHFVTTYADTGEVKRHVERIRGRKEKTFFFEHGETIIHMTGSGLVNANGVFILRYPFRQGYTWEQSGIRLVYSGVGVTVTVPAGTFTECVEVTWYSTKDDRDYVSKCTYAPNVGPVKYEYYAINEAGQSVPLMESVLEKFVERG